MKWPSFVLLMSISSPAFAAQPHVTECERTLRPAQDTLIRLLEWGIDHQYIRLEDWKRSTNSSEELENFLVWIRQARRNPYFHQALSQLTARGVSAEQLKAVDELSLKSRLENEARNLVRRSVHPTLNLSFSEQLSTVEEPAQTIPLLIEESDRPARFIEAFWQMTKARLWFARFQNEGASTSGEILFPEITPARLGQTSQAPVLSFFGEDKALMSHISEEEGQTTLSILKVDFALQTSKLLARQTLGSKAENRHFLAVMRLNNELWVLTGQGWSENQDARLWRFDTRTHQLKTHAQLRQYGTAHSDALLTYLKQSPQGRELHFIKKMARPSARRSSGLYLYEVPLDTEFSPLVDGTLIAGTESFLRKSSLLPESEPLLVATGEKYILVLALERGTPLLIQPPNHSRYGLDQLSLLPSNQVLIRAETFKEGHRQGFSFFLLDNVTSSVSAETFISMGPGTFSNFVTSPDGRVFTAFVGCSRDSRESGIWIFEVFIEEPPGSLRLEPIQKLRSNHDATTLRLHFFGEQGLVLTRTLLARDLKFINIYRSGSR